MSQQPSPVAFFLLIEGELRYLPVHDSQKKLNEVVHAEGNGWPINYTFDIEYNTTNFEWSPLVDFSLIF